MIHQAIVSAHVIETSDSKFRSIAAEDAHKIGRMKPSLQLRLSQHLALTPQLQQSIRLLQLS
ncbi:hypothetical protein ABTD55_23565, partial [Acinetobacter baumannii]